jgi:hypothetical protein
VPRTSTGCHHARAGRGGLGHTTRDAADQFTESYDTQSNIRRKTLEICVICHDLLRPSLANLARRMSRAAGLVRPGAGGGGGRAGLVCRLLGNDHSDSNAGRHVSGGGGTVGEPECGQSEASGAGGWRGCMQLLLRSVVQRCTACMADAGRHPHASTCGSSAFLFRRRVELHSWKMILR